MNKSTIIYLLLLLSFFTLSLGEECSDYNDAKSKACIFIKLSDSDKSCLYLNNECKELPKECEKYTGSVALECESINLETQNTICIFENNVCQKKTVNSCSAYKAGTPGGICKNIITPEGLNCELVDNECKPHYNKCSDYDGKDQKICESIELYSPYSYCSISGENCVEQQKNEVTCSSYKSGQNPQIYCQNIQLGNGKHCIFYNNKCSEYFTQCDSVGGTNENDCNSNIPEKSYRYKCLYEGEKCTKVQKTCSDYKEGGYDSCESITLEDENKECIIVDGKCTEIDKKTKCSDYKQGEGSSICTGIKLADYRKHCVFTNNECKESYRLCGYYTESDASVCNSIITISKGRCVYDNGCKDKIMQCSEYTSILDEDGGQSCVSLNPSNVMKKCVYSDHNCNEEDKLCTEFTSGATKELCEKAPTSSDKKKCVLSDDNKSCVEKDGAYFIKAFSSLLFLLLL